MSAKLTYLGWSGFRIAYPGLPEIVLDPPGGAQLPRDAELVICISHGHPEHFLGALAYLQDPSRTAPVTLLASEQVSRYLKRHSSHSEDRFIPCKAGERHDLDGITIGLFGWKHMSLLPPGLGPSLAHLFRLITHPILAAGIIADGLGGPGEGPMLGFHLAPAKGERILAYGEGMHRLLEEAEATKVGVAWPADLLLTAVEPEDLEQLPGLMQAAGAPKVIPFEAHRPWREGFGMSVVDLDALASALDSQGMQTATVAIGESCTLG